jgi:hypothetical protein
VGRLVGADNYNNFQAPPMSPLAQRFAEAVRTLVGDGPVKVRLVQAFATNLADLADVEFPAALRRDFADLQIALNRVAPVGNESRVRASVQKMSADQAGSHAATIVKLYVELLNTLERAEPLKVVSSPKKPPQYLTNRN